ncbi:MAG: hypothetical protein JNM31_03195 [Flavobacteriales bacterium]|nr:hypothetical protein [Flavobacteriales bacterium]
MPRWSYLLFTLLMGLLLLWAFRGPLYRTIVSYQIGEVRDRSSATYPNYRQLLQPSAAHPGGVDEAILRALTSVAAQLHFAPRNAPSDPVVLLAGSEANCIGYAAAFTARCRFELEHLGLGDEWSVQQHRATLHLGAFNLHALTRDPFWMDHDVAVLTSRNGKDRVVVDPTLFDALGIGRVRAHPQHAP